jgi:hypothetical protein
MIHHDRPPGIGRKDLPNALTHPAVMMNHDPTKAGRVHLMLGGFADHRFPTHGLGIQMDGSSAARVPWVS